MPRPVPRVALNCAHCGNGFEKMACELTRGRGRFCSRACMAESRKRVVRLSCERCGAQFERKTREVGAHSWCSQDCYKAARAANATSYPKEGSVHKHRKVAEQKLGRALRPGEVVHHKDGNKRNWNPSNIEVLSSQAEHNRLHFLGVPKSEEHRQKLREHLARVRGPGARKPGSGKAGQ